MKPSPDALQQRLQQHFPDAHIHVRDDSHHHAGHAGAAGGAGHFAVTLISSAFDGLSTVARHRLVYDAVADWMPHRIHALSITARTAAAGADGPHDASPAQAAQAGSGTAR
ncbi:MAG: BolA family protein [Lautropia sp.]|nr:BolA family protein [Lautropia sp.]